MPYLELVTVKDRVRLRVRDTVRDRATGWAREP